MNGLLRITLFVLVTHNVLSAPSDGYYNHEPQVIKIDGCHGEGKYEEGNWANGDGSWNGGNGGWNGGNGGWNGGWNGGNGGWNGGEKGGWKGGNGGWNGGNGGWNNGDGGYGGWNNGDGGYGGWNHGDGGDWNGGNGGEWLGDGKWNQGEDGKWNGVDNANIGKWENGDNADWSGGEWMADGGDWKGEALDWKPEGGAEWKKTEGEGEQGTEWKSEGGGEWNGDVENKGIEQGEVKHEVVDVKQDGKFEIKELKPHFVPPNPFKGRIFIHRPGPIIVKPAPTKFYMPASPIIVKPYVVHKPSPIYVKPVIINRHRPQPVHVKPVVVKVIKQVGHGSKSGWSRPCNNGHNNGPRSNWGHGEQY